MPSLKPQSERCAHSNSITSGDPEATANLGPESDETTTDSLIDANSDQQAETVSLTHSPTDPF